MQGVKEDRYGGEELPPFSIAVCVMTTRTMGGPLMAITVAIVEGGGSAETKRNKLDAPPQAWTIHPLLGLRAPPPQPAGPVLGLSSMLLRGAWGFGWLQSGHALRTPSSIMSKKADDAGGGCKGGCTIADPRQRGKVWAQTTKYQ
jgi:hypothetical protein